MSPEKMIGLFFAASAAKLYEAFAKLSSRHPQRMAAVLSIEDRAEGFAA